MRKRAKSVRSVLAKDVRSAHDGETCTPPSIARVGWDGGDRKGGREFSVKLVRVRCRVVSLQHPVLLRGQLICYLTDHSDQETSRSGLILTWRVLLLKPTVK